MGFGLSLEQPTVTEQTISTAAKISAPVFLPQAMELRFSAVLRIALMRVIGLPPADERRYEECTEGTNGKRIHGAGVTGISTEKARGARNTVWAGEHGGRQSFRVSRFSKERNSRLHLPIGKICRGT
jgi:hypothetical protein